jgi:hypothetical protein
MASNFTLTQRCVRACVLLSSAELSLVSRLMQITRHTHSHSHTNPHDTLPLPTNPHDTLLLPANPHDTLLLPANPHHTLPAHQPTSHVAPAHQPERNRGQEVVDKPLEAQITAQDNQGLARSSREGASGPPIPALVPSNAFDAQLCEEVSAVLPPSAPSPSPPPLPHILTYSRHTHKHARARAHTHTHTHKR